MRKFLPPIARKEDLIPRLKQWERKISKAISRPRVPRIPWNFKVTSKRGGLQLTWSLVDEADGYEVLQSDDTNFSEGVNVISIPGKDQTAYFDAAVPVQAGSPPTRHYKIRAMAGTTSNPHAVRGLLSGVVSAQAIDPADTTTAETSFEDTVITDRYQSATRRRLWGL